MTLHGIYARLAVMSRAPSPPVRTPRVLDYSSYAVLVIMGGLGVVGLDAWPHRLLAIVMCLVFGALYAWLTLTTLAVGTLIMALLLQTVAVTVAIALHSSAYEAFAFLLMLQAVHVSSMLSPFAAAIWVLALWGIHAAVTLAFLSDDAWFVIVFNLGIYLVCWVVGHVLRQLAVSKDDLEHALLRLRRAQEHIRALAVDEERGRLARDLHDSVKQNLFAAGMQIGTARALLSTSPREAGSALGEGDQLIRRASSDLGLVIHELRPVELGEVGLAAALQEYACGWSRQTGIEVRFAAEVGADSVDGAAGSDEAVPAEIAHALLRVAQEALANIIRHSGANRVDMQLIHTGRIRLTVRDDGSGFAPAQVNAGVGLSSMRERVEQLGGKLAVSSTPGEGAEVIAEVGGQ